MMSSGFVESMVTMTVAAVGFVGMVQFMDDGRQVTTASDVSAVLLEFADAAQAYATQRQTTLNASIAANAEVPIALSRSTLVGTGYLASAFPSTTSLGQTMTAYVRRVPTSDPAALGAACSTYTADQGVCPLEVMVVTDGGVTPSADLRGAAMRFGSTRIGEVASSSVARGPGWSTSLTPFQTGAAFDAGQLVARTNVEAIQATPWIARTVIDGHPELARMSQTLSFEAGAGANIDLNGNDLDDANEIRAAAFIYGSDCRLKENVQGVSAAEAREILGRLTLYRFRYRGTDRVRFGYMAQQVQKVAEEVVFEGPDGILRIDYPQLSTLVIAALADTEDGNPQAEEWSCPDAADSER
jgi:hypothetical protein